MYIGTHSHPPPASPISKICMPLVAANAIVPETANVAQLVRKVQQEHEGGSERDPAGAILERIRMATASLQQDPSLSISTDLDVAHNGETRDPRSGKMVSVVPAATFCTQCSTLSSPQWRPGPFGHRTLCNARGVRWMKVGPKRKCLKYNVRSILCNDHCSWNSEIDLK